MPTTTRVPLISPSPGTTRHLAVRRYGLAGARPKIYLQAALHANELPGILVLHHLVRRLDDAEAAGAIKGEIVVVPTANPIGLGQSINGKQVGRFELAGAGNFNRGFSRLADTAAKQLGNRLGEAAEANVAAVREALLAAVADLDARSEMDSLRKALLSHSVDADIVLDLHSHGEAVLYLYMPEAFWPGSSDLPAQLGCRRVLTWSRDDGHSFDEANGAPWLALAKAFPDRPIPPSCLGVTLELRGHNQADDALSGNDALNLFRFMQRRGIVAGDPGPLPALAGTAAPADGLDHLRAPIGGIAVFRKALGEEVAEGEVVAEIVDPVADDPARARAPVKARTHGMFFGRDMDLLVRPGDAFASVSGPEPLPEPEPSTD
ncbi:MAG: succinylglutamate desuccinylase/aspartoacylase family protein [Alphaproteobacteria bacterium]|nr:succinylglutamate desuccinylase/aspartoacylase family protein [Alphaproteobacteria bacterium]